MSSKGRTPESDAKFGRRPIEPDVIASVLRDLENSLARGLQKKGDGGWVSRHEILGANAEEWKEVMDAVHAGVNDDIYRELRDLATTCLIGMASLAGGHTQW